MYLPYFVFIYLLYIILDNLTQHTTSHTCIKCRLEAPANYISRITYRFNLHGNAPFYIGLYGSRGKVEDLNHDAFYVGHSRMIEYPIIIYPHKVHPSLERNKQTWNQLNLEIDLFASNLGIPSLSFTGLCLSSPIFHDKPNL